jgi:inorganic pyrophosphatase
VHYFATYKLTGDHAEPLISKVYDRDEAWRVIEAAMQDYAEKYGG